jgi:Tol biopolymer transport system component
MRPSKPRRRAPAIAGAAAAVALLLAGGGLLRAYLGDDGQNTADSPAKKSGGPPIEPMLVRIDTKAGWPKECHADIGTYTPGQSAPVPLLRGDACDTLPERSPDRTKVAFTRKVGDQHEAWVMGTDGGDARRVAGGLSGGRVTWSPDGSQLAFMRRDAGVRQIYAIALGQTEPRRLTGDSADKDDPMWSSTGRLAFWSKRDGVEQIYTLVPENPAAPWTRLSKDGVPSVDPEWSPDGTRIAYTRGAYPGGHVWVMNADGSSPRQLTTGGQHEMDAAWSRDGKWICYARGPYASPEIRTIRADGTGDRPFGPTNGVIGHPNWS